MTASATYHRIFREGSIWASTVAWGRNQEPGNDATNAFLAETNLTLDERDAWFGRFEFAGKFGRDLAIESHDIFPVAKLQAGYTRYFDAWKGLKPSIGAGVSAGVVPDSLKPFYGTRVNVGLAVFVTLRPAERGM